MYYDSYKKSIKCCTKKSRIGLVAKTALKIPGVSFISNIISIMWNAEDRVAVNEDKMTDAVIFPDYIHPRGDVNLVENVLFRHKGQKNDSKLRFLKKFLESSVYKYAIMGSRLSSSHYDRAAGDLRFGRPQR